MTIGVRSLLKVGGAALVASAIVRPAAAQAPASTWDAVRKNGKLRIGVTQAPPWFSKNPTTGKWDSGVVLAVAQKLAKDLGVELETVEVTWATSIASLQSDKIDVAFLDPTPERAKVVDFPVQPLLYFSLALLARDDLPASTWADLNKPEVKIAVPQATSQDAFLTRNTPKADIQRFPDNAASIAAFQSGRVDAVCLFHPPLLAARQRLGKGKLVVPTPAYTSPSSLALRREADKTFRDWIGQAIFFYYETGQTQLMYEEFLTSFGLDPKQSPPIQKDLLGSR